MSANSSVLARPIFILGAPRSGTAILAHILRAHRNLAYLREPRLVWRFGNDGRSDLLRREDARPEVREHVRAYFARAVVEQGRSRLLEKTPSNSMRPAFVDEIFPDAVFIHVRRTATDNIAAIRDRWLEPPRDLRQPMQRDRLVRHIREAGLARSRHYAKEMIQKLTPRQWSRFVGVRPWGPHLPGLDGLVRDLDVLDVATLQWRMCVEQASWYGRQLPADRYRECRLEALDQATVRELAAFCGLDDDPAVAAAYDSQYDPGRIVSRGETLSADERARVDSWIAPTLAWLGESVT